MPSFGVARLPRTILFGPGQRDTLPRIVSEFGIRALVCTDARLAQDAIFLNLVSHLESAGIQTLVFSSTIPELPLACVEECAAFARSFRPNAVVGIGGGSCLDMAKLSAVLLTHDVKLQDCYGEFRVPGRTLPVVAIPTTSGTGSEATPVAVVSPPDRETKVGISSPYLIPEAAICDPELTYSCPPGLTATAGVDALTHAVEAYTAIQREGTADLPFRQVFVGKNNFSDHYALSAIQLISSSLKRVVQDGSDKNGRAKLMLGSLHAGMAFAAAGTAAAHAIQYPVGAMTHTAHGIGVAALLPYVMEFNLPTCVDTYAEIAYAMGVADRGSDQLASAKAAIEAIDQLFEDVGIPKTLDALGLKADQVEWTVDAALKAQRLVNNNPRALDAPAVHRIVAAARNGNRLELRDHQVEN